MASIRLVLGTLLVAAVVLPVGSAAAQDDGMIPARLTFADALRLAEAGNPALRGARTAADIARADAREAGSRPNPVIALEGEKYAAFEPHRPSFWRGQALILRFEQEIETAGRRGYRVRAADAGLDVARSENEDAGRRLHLDVGRMYFALVLAQADRVVAEDALEEIEQVIRLMQARFAAGEVAGTELRRLEVERLHFVDQVFMTTLAVSDARVVLLGLLGAADLLQPIEAADSLSAPPLLDPDGRVIATADGVSVAADVLRAEALASRPDLRAARHARERAGLEIQWQRALGVPNVTAAWGYRNDFGTHAMDFEVSMPVPLFGSLNPGGVQRAEAVRRRAAAHEDAAVIAVGVELQRAVRAVEINAQRVRYIEQEYVVSAEQVRDLVRASYELGETALIDFLDAQRGYRETQWVRNQALYGMRISLIELAVAVGVPPAAGP